MNIIDGFGDCIIHENRRSFNMTDENWFNCRREYEIGMICILHDLLVA
jgi:hypothetical protein